MIGSLGRHRWYRWVPTIVVANSEKPVGEHVFCKSQIVACVLCIFCVNVVYPKRFFPENTTLEDPNFLVCGVLLSSAERAKRSVDGRRAGEGIDEYEPYVRRS